MIIILAILAATRASPLGQPSPPLVSRNIFQQPACPGSDGYRSLWDIIRSCVVTILLCTWASVHPNIPSPDDRWPKIAVRRVGLLLAALIMPEVITGWALRQRLAASRLGKEHKEKGWTTTHGFFAIMGGFMEYDGNQPIRVLLPEELQSYSLTGNGDFPKISKAEIEDKSKGDFLAKAVVILQTGWFALQCLTRAALGLSITELELITLAFATLNIFVYALWWHKPLNVRRGVRVYKQRITEQSIDDGDVEVEMGHWDALLEALSELPAAIVDGPMTLKFPRIPWLFRVIGWPFLIPSQILGIGIQNQEHQNLKRVATFYPDSWPTEPTMVAGLAFVVAISLAFGGIHFLILLWVVTAPSSTVISLWLVASISSVVVPVTLFLSIVIIWKRKFPHVPRIFELILGLQLGLYILHRLVLLILPFWDVAVLDYYTPDSDLNPFRFFGDGVLDPDVFSVVPWASYIPHV